MLGTAGVADAEFPYARPGADKKDYTQLRTDKGQVPPDLNEENTWKFAATPEPNNLPVNLQPQEQFGVRGGSVADADASKDTAWTVTTGRPDVSIAVLDSGIRWRELDLHNKIRLNRGELPKPNHGGPALLGGVSCGSYGSDYDANGDGVFNLVDYACDSRLRKDTPSNVLPGTFDPQDVLIAFSDGSDADGNGYADDIAGWDFLDDDNDAFDDVDYGHGTGEAQGSTSEVADNRGDQGTCPNCMFVPTRVGDSFVADASRFAQAVIYGVDNGVYVIQEALGTLNNTRIAREAIDYAYNHGVVVIASAADEAAQHHNYVSSLPHTIVVNSVRNNEIEGVPGIPKSYLAFNGCTNFGSKITLAIPSTSCSSDATGVGSGMAGLIYSAALNGVAQGKLSPHPTCRRTDGSPCPLSANEVRQLMASGAFGAQAQPDDVNFLAAQPVAEPSCAGRPDGCTDPNGALQTQVNANRPIVFPPDSRSYPARFGHDQFYGWGRVNTFRAVDRPARGYTNPEVEITSPDWFAQVDPGQPTAELRAQVWARGAPYSCKVYVAPGSYPNNHLTTDAQPGDFKAVPSPVCDGTNRTDPIDGAVAALDLADLKSRFPSDACDFRDREPGCGAGQTSNGRPNSDPYGFTVRVVATVAAAGSPPVAATGEDRRNLYLHRDQDLLDGFPKRHPGGTESSPAFADLDGDNRNELIYGTDDGRVNAIKPDGSQAPGWPVHSDPLPLHTGGRAFKSGEVSEGASFGSFLASVAVADLDRDGSLEVLAADFEGKVYAWSSRGKLVWKREANPAYSGKPLKPFENVRKGKTNRTQHGFIGSPVAADLDRDDGGRLEVIAAGMDRHVYAFQHDGSGVPGYPVLVVDPAKVESVDGATHRVGFKSDARADDEQGAIIDTPGVGNVAGDARPEIVVGTNEQYSHGGSEGGANIGGGNAVSSQILSRTGALANANTRLFALKPEGDRDANPKTPDWSVAGWPVKMTLLMPGLLPVVGEGVTGAPALAPLECPNGGKGLKIGAFGNNGVGYVFNGDGTSCIGRDDSGDHAMDTDTGGGGDRPTFPAVGHPAFGNFAGGVSFLGPTAGLIRALDVAAPEYQTGGQDFVSAWDPTTGKFRSGFPARMNDLQFITGPSVADIDGKEGEELLEGSAHLDLQAYDGGGAAVARFPKLTSDWMVANPLIGSFGTLDTDAAARKTVVASTRNGAVFAYRTGAPACSPASWPKFHHDLANSGDYTRDAVDPGAPIEVKLFERGLGFKAPGDDLLCGRAARYELVSSDSKLDAASFAEGNPIPVALKPGEPGAVQAVELGGSLQRYLALRAVDDQGNVGPVTVLSTRDPLPGAPPGLDSSAGLCNDRKAPLSSIKVPVTASRRGKRLLVRGRTADTGCRTAAERNALATSVSIARRDGRKCRFLGPDNRFGKRRSCSKPVRLRTKGKYSLKRLKLEWSFTAKRVKLGRGRYVVRAYGADQSGNVERKTTRRNSKEFRVR
ncbi:MAG TPA: S8 family serine peptidase [Thermoleophilaceae bacterium]